ncbi:MAG: hypothetical protein ACXABY_00015 [Candidatus Thorarchaeota archaeon]|jgi:hypothetical protein
MLKSVMDESTELILGEDRYSRWCQAEHVKELYTALKRKVEDVTFYLTGHKDHSKKLPKGKFRRKVAIYAGDETGRKIPPFIDQVDLVFRECNHEGKLHDKVYPKPLGYNTRHRGQNDNSQPFSGVDKQWSERKTKVFFSGQSHVQDRREMANVLRGPKRRGWDITITLGFAEGYSVPEYYRRMSNSKIVLCPKGGAPECFRYTEAFKCGCAVITTFLPKEPLWYYDKSPAYYIPSWNCLTRGLVEEVILPKGENVRKESIDYYNRYLSEEAQADYIARVIATL